MQDISIDGSSMKYETPRKSVTNKPVPNKGPTVEAPTEGPGAFVNTPPDLLRNTWETLEAGVTIRMFLPADYSDSTVSFILVKFCNDIEES